MMLTKKILSFVLILIGVALLIFQLHFLQGAPLLSITVASSFIILIGLFSIVFPSFLYFFPFFLLGLYLQLTPLIFWYPSWPPYLMDTLVGIVITYLSFHFLHLPPLSKHIAPKGWRLTPSSWLCRIPASLIAWTCFFLSSYLALFELGYISTAWDPVFGDGTYKVLTSSISKSFPVPDAGLGAISYALEAILALYGRQDRWKTVPWAVLSFGVLALPVGIVSIILIFLQPLAVHAWCFLCLVIALLNGIVAILSASEVYITLVYLKRIHAKGGSVLKALFEGFT